MDHGDDFIIVLNSQQNIIQISQWLPIGGYLKFLHLLLEKISLVLWPSLQNHIHPSHEDQIR